MWDERYMSRLKDIVAMPWVLLSCGFWMVLAFIRGQQLRYGAWKIRHLEAERDRYQRRARDLERRLAGDEELF